MRTKIFYLVGAVAALTIGGCARTPQSTMARAPHIDIPASNASNAKTADTSDTKSGAAYDSQSGFENALPPPDAVGGGPVPGVDSDVGEPKWRNNPGSFDDGKRPRSTNPSKQHDHEPIQPPALK